MREFLTTFLMFLLLLSPIQSVAGPACTAPSTWPLGDHLGEVAQNGARIVQTRGWDPVFFTDRGHQALKDDLTRGISTFHVGLPGPQEPGDLRRWTGSCEWSNASLASAGLPTISLATESGGRVDGVYLVAGYNMQGCTILLQAGVKVAVWGSAFKDIRTVAASEGVWIVDSLIDADSGVKGPFRGGEQNSTCKTHVMYSEQMGGLDVGKTHNMTYYRNHLHGSMKVDDGHADGLQINSNSNCAFLYENTMDFLFRMTNRPLFLQNSNPGGIHNTWVVNNIIAGGANCMDMCRKTSDNAPRFGPCTNSIICGNRCLASDQNVSWATPSTDISPAAAVLNDGDGISGYHYREGNGFYSGSGGHRTSVRDNEGDLHSVQSSPVVPASYKSEIDKRVALIETWVSQIRSAAGAGGTPPPPPSNAPAPPVLLD